MAFVLIQHLDPKHHSMLAELLAKETIMKVSEVTGLMKVQPDHVYVIPPNAAMTIRDLTLHLSPREESPGGHMTTDYFMRSLAEDQGNRAVGVILSGTGSDGTLGMVEIQAHGGITFAQDESTAKYDGMPRSAIAAGCVDYVLSPKDIAHELARIARHPYVFRDRGAGSAEIVAAGSAGLSSIFSMLRRSTGLDFTHYRQTTIVRRIHRRMVVHKIEKLDAYVKFLRENPAELKALYQDMLINVTSFFRNPRVFDALKSQIFPNILRNRAPESTIRIWTPGCASGEETFSLAILLLEFLGDKAGHVPVQLFGTDISESSISKARGGRLSGKYTRGRFGGEAAAVFHEDGGRLSHQQEHSRYVYFRAAQSFERSAVFADGSDLLPQFADLFGAGAAEQSDFAVSLCDSRQRVFGAGNFGGRGAFDQSIRAGGSGT